MKLSRTSRASIAVAAVAGHHQQRCCLPDWFKLRVLRRKQEPAAQHRSWFVQDHQELDQGLPGHLHREQGQGLVRRHSNRWC